MREILKLKRCFLLILLPFAFICLAVAKTSSFVAEYVFARGIYKVLSVPVGFVSSLFPFSIAELVIVLLPVVAVFAVVRWAVHIVRWKEKRSITVKKGILNLLCFISVVSAMFILMCGTNYYRYTFGEMYGLEIKERSVDELKELCLYLKEQSELSKSQIGKENLDENGVVVFKEGGTYENFRQVSRAAGDAMRELAHDYTSLKYSAGAAKEVFFSRYMSYGGIVGIFIPFTVEANVNTDVADYNRAADTCHELAHMRGYMKEQEANYIAYLACVNTDDPVFRYSGYMLAFIHATNALYDCDPDAYWDIMDGLSVEVLADLKYENEYWDKLRENEVVQAVDNVVTNVNDTYLKVNGQESGVKSYGQMVDLLLAEQENRN